MTRMIWSTTLLALFACATLLAGGCASDEVTADDVRSDMTPALDSTARSSGQYWNMEARAIDHDWRQISDDFAWLILLDQPLHLTEYPIP